MEFRNVEKLVTTLSAEGSIDPIIQGGARTIIAFERVRQYLQTRDATVPRAPRPPRHVNSLIRISAKQWSMTMGFLSPMESVMSQKE